MLAPSPGARQQNGNCGLFPLAPKSPPPASLPRPCCAARLSRYDWIGPDGWVLLSSNILSSRPDSFYEGRDVWGTMGEREWESCVGHPGEAGGGRLRWGLCSLQKFLFAAERGPSSRKPLAPLQEHTSGGILPESHHRLRDSQGCRDSERSPVRIALPRLRLCQSPARRGVAGLFFGE